MHFERCRHNLQSKGPVSRKEVVNMIAFLEKESHKDHRFHIAADIKKMLEQSKKLLVNQKIDKKIKESNVIKILRLVPYKEFLQEARREYCREVLSQNKNIVSKAARSSGLSREVIRRITAIREKGIK